MPNKNSYFAEDVIKAMQEQGLKSNFTREQFDVIVDGKVVTCLNSYLAKRQNCSEDDIKRIRKLHALKYRLHTMAKENLDDGDMLRMLAKQDDEIEFELQRSWHFPIDAKFHRPWNFPGCTCPRMDNEDMYGTGHFVIDLSCPVHGDGE